MPRKLNFRRGFTNAASSALGVAPTANPYLIGGAAVVGGVTGVLTPDRTFDPSPFRQGFQRYATGVRSGARRAAAEAGSQTATQLAAQGLSASPLGAGVTAGQRRLALQRGEDLITQERGQLEADLAGAQTAIAQQNQRQVEREFTGVAEAGLALGENILTQNSPLREKLGLPPIQSPADELLRSIFNGDAASPSATQAITGGAQAPVAPAPAIQGQISGQNAPVGQHRPKLGYDASRTQVDSKLEAEGISKGSKLGRAYHSNPEAMQQLEDAFGLDYLKDVFNLGV